MAEPDAWTHRAAERGLLGWLLAAVSCGYASVALMRDGMLGAVPLSAAGPLLVFAGTVVLMHMLLVVCGARGDVFVLPAVSFLAGTGVIVQLRLAAQPTAWPPALAELVLPLAGLVLVATAVVGGGARYRGLQRVDALALLTTWAVLAVLLVFGQRFRGGMYLPGGLNPSELAKPLAVVFLAGYAVRHRKAFETAALGVPAPLTRAGLGLWLGWGGVNVLLVLLRDLGMLVLLNAVCLCMLYALTRRRRLLVLGTLAGAALLAGVYLLSAHSRARMLAWWDPFADPTGRGWQVLQSLSAIYSGGLFGLGLGSGTPQAIPIASSDFVYAALGEELGYIGCGILLAVYALLIHRCLRIANAVRDPFGRLLATGLGTLLALQVLLNVGGVTKALPLTGLTLPFVSHGGSSLVTSCLCIGLLLAISADAPDAPAASGRRAAKRKPARRRGTRKS